MFETHFQLQHRPFPSVPTPDRYYAASTIESARLSLVRLVERDEGPGLVIGAAGTGKTMLCHVLAESLREQYHVVRLPSGRLRERRALLQSILYELGQPYRDLDEGELRLALIDHVTDQNACPRGILILVDEAESLALSLMDELRTMTNLTASGQACVKLILLGNQRLEEKFADPRMESFAQRIAGRFYLENYNRNETHKYIEHQILEGGGNPQMIMAECAMDKIYQAAEGVPRLINQLCDHAMILCTINGVDRMTAQDVEDAWTDLQQLPVPGAPLQEASLPNVVEFGQLDAESVAESVEATIETIEQELPPELPIEPPEVELVLHDDRVQDPFDESFEEELVVIDKYAAPDDLSNRYRRQVLCEDSHKIASQLDEVLQQIREATRPTPQGEIIEADVERPADEDPEPNIVTFSSPLDDSAQSNDIDLVDEPSVTRATETVHALADTEETIEEDEQPAFEQNTIEEQATQTADGIEDLVEDVSEVPREEPVLIEEEEERLAASEARSGDDDVELEKVDATADETPATSSPEKKTYRNLFSRLQNRD